MAFSWVTVIEEFKCTKIFQEYLLAQLCFIKFQVQTWGFADINLRQKIVCNLSKDFKVFQFPE